MSHEEQQQLNEEERTFSKEIGNPMKARVVALSKMKNVDLTSIFTAISYLYNKETNPSISSRFFKKETKKSSTLPTNFVAVGGRNKWAIVEIQGNITIRIVRIASGADGVVYAIHFQNRKDLPPMAVKVQDCNKRSYYKYEIQLMEIATELAQNHKLSHFPVLYGAKV